MKEVNDNDKRGKNLDVQLDKKYQLLLILLSLNISMQLLWKNL
jgi:hypothetical protein